MWTALLHLRVQLEGSPWKRKSEFLSNPSPGIEVLQRDNYYAFGLGNVLPPSSEELISMIMVQGSMIQLSRGGM